MSTYFNVFGDKGGIVLNDNTPLYYLKSKTLLNAYTKTVISASSASGYNKSRCIDAESSRYHQESGEWVYNKYVARDVISYRITKQESEICALSMFANMDNVTFTSPSENTIDINFPSTFDKANSVYVYTFCVAKNANDLPDNHFGLEILNANGVRIFNSADRNYLKNIHVMNPLNEYQFANDLTNSSYSTAVRKASDYNGIIINALTHSDSYPCCSAIFEKDAVIELRFAQVYSGSSVAFTAQKINAICKTNDFVIGGPTYSYNVMIEKTVNQKYKISMQDLEYNIRYNDIYLKDENQNIIDNTHGITQSTDETIILQVAKYLSDNARTLSITYYADESDGNVSYTASQPVTFLIDRDITVTSKTAVSGTVTYTVTVQPSDNEIITVTTNRGVYTSTFTAYYGDNFTATVASTDGHTPAGLNITSGVIKGDILITSAEEQYTYIYGGNGYNFYDEDGRIISSVDRGDSPYYYRKNGGAMQRVGGTIFDINTYALDGEDAFYVYNADESTSSIYSWAYASGSSTETPSESFNTSRNLGKGRSNTLLMLNNANYVNNVGTYGHNTIWNYINHIRNNGLNGRNDWYIPSETELDYLIRLVATNKYQNRYVWSSSSFSKDYAYCWAGNGTEYNFRSGCYLAVPVRSF